MWEHIEYIARLHNTQEWEEYADDLLEMFNLTHRADDLPGTFSRGLKQKTGLILGLIRPFSLLLIDEPFAGLDGPGQETLVEVLGDIAEQGAAIVCSTHQLELLQVATRRRRAPRRRAVVRRQALGRHHPRPRLGLTHGLVTAARPAGFATRCRPKGPCVRAVFVPFTGAFDTGHLHA